MDAAAQKHYQASSAADVRQKEKTKAIATISKSTLAELFEQRVQDAVGKALSMTLPRQDELEPIFFLQGQQLDL